MRNNQKKIFFFIAGFLLFVIMIITLSKKNLGTVDKVKNRVISEELILDIIDKDSESLIKHFDFYNQNFEKISEEITWVKDNLSPYVESYGRPAEKVLTFASFLPFPWIDKLSNWSKKAVTLVVTASTLTSDFAIQSDSLSKLFTEIRSLHSEYKSNREKTILLMMKEKINLELSLQMYEMQKTILTIKTVLSDAREVVSVINQISEYLEKAGKLVKDLFSEKQMQEIESDHSQMEIMKQISENEKITESINEKFSNDLELIAEIKSAFSILNKGFPNDY